MGNWLASAIGRSAWRRWTPRQASPHYSWPCRLHGSQTIERVGERTSDRASASSRGIRGQLLLSRLAPGCGDMENAATRVVRGLNLAPRAWSARLRPNSPSCSTTNSSKRDWLTWPRKKEFLTLPTPTLVSRANATRPISATRRIWRWTGKRAGAPQAEMTSANVAPESEELLAKTAKRSPTHLTKPVSATSTHRCEQVPSSAKLSAKRLLWAKIS